MIDKAEMSAEARTGGKRSYKLLIASMLVGIGIGYALGCIQSWLFS